MVGDARLAVEALAPLLAGHRSDETFARQAAAAMAAWRDEVAVHADDLTDPAPATSFAHLDACFYTGQAHVDFVRFLVENGARPAVETWTNNGVVSLEDPSLRPRAEDPAMVDGAVRLIFVHHHLA